MEPNNKAVSSIQKKGHKMTRWQTWIHHKRMHKMPSKLLLVIFFTLLVILQLVVYRDHVTLIETEVSIINKVKNSVCLDNDVRNTDAILIAILIRNLYIDRQIRQVITSFPIRLQYEQKSSELGHVIIFSSQFKSNHLFTLTHGIICKILEAYYLN